MKPRDAIALLSLAALWGASFLFIRIAVKSLGPLTLAEARVALAGAALLIYIAGLRRSIELRRRWKTYLALGALNAALPYLLISAAELQLTAGMAAILNATTPLFGAVAAAMWANERLTARKIAGLFIGFAAVVAVAGWSSLPQTGATALAVAASLGGALSYGIAGVYARRALAGAPPLASAAGQQLGAVALLTPVAVPLALTARLDVSTSVIWAVLALALACTSLAYVLYFGLIASAGATSTLTVTFLVPFFGLLWSAIFLREPVTTGALVGLALIAISLPLVTGMALPLGRLRGPRTQPAIHR